MRIIYSLCLCIFACFFIDCQKQDDWLDAKYRTQDVVPKTVADYQSLLDKSGTFTIIPTSYNLLSCDNTSFTNSVYSTLDAASRNLYVWNKDIWELNGTQLWNGPYSSIFVSNAILEGLEKIESGTYSITDYNSVKGQALFYRGQNFYVLVQSFSKQYDANTANLDLGIPLRLSSDVNETSKRATVQASYDRILADLTAASTLLPDKPLVKTRPGKAAALMLLAKIYLAKADYTNALTYTNQALALQNAIVNFNTITPTGPTVSPFPVVSYAVSQTNSFAEIIHTQYYSLTSTGIARLNLDTILYKSYSDNDLRKTLFYAVTATNPLTITFKGKYTGVNTIFCGLATNELQFIKAEALARTNKVPDAMQVLNDLLINRWKTNTYTPYSAITMNDALTIIYDEKRKELPFTGMVRWEDLRRLNKETQWAKTLTRTVLNQSYSLPPNDPKWVLPIPEEEVRLSGIEQNPR